MQDFWTSSLVTTSAILIMFFIGYAPAEFVTLRGTSSNPRYCVEHFASSEGWYKSDERIYDGVTLRWQINRRKYYHVTDPFPAVLVESSTVGHISLPSKGCHND